MNIEYLMSNTQFMIESFIHQTEYCALQILIRFPELLSNCRHVVFRSLLQQHLRAYTTAHRAVHADEHDTRRSEISLDNTLAIWYARKLRNILQYCDLSNLQRIIDCQRMIRGQLARLRSKKILNTQQGDPIHTGRILKQLLRSMERIERRVEGLEKQKRKKDKKERRGEALSPVDEQVGNGAPVDEALFEIEWRRMKSEYKQKLRQQMSNATTNQPPVSLSPFASPTSPITERSDDNP